MIDGFHFTLGCVALMLCAALVFVDADYRANAVKSECAVYHYQTGKFTWRHEVE